MAYGFVVKDDSRNVIHKGGGGYKPNRKNTNNKAEYHALSAALQYLSTEADLEDVDTLKFYGDSQLVINQMSGYWRVNSPSIIKLYGLCNDMLRGLINSKGIVKATFYWIPRRENKEADYEANRQLNTMRYS